MNNQISEHIIKKLYILYYILKKEKEIFEIIEKIITI